MFVVVFTGFPLTMMGKFPLSNGGRRHAVGSVQDLVRLGIGHRNERDLNIPVAVSVG